MKSYAQNEAKGLPTLKRRGSAPQLTDPADLPMMNAAQQYKPNLMPGLFNRLAFTRSRSAPPTPRDGAENLSDNTEKVGEGAPAEPDSDGIHARTVPNIVDYVAEEELQPFTGPDLISPQSPGYPSFPEPALPKTKVVHHSLAITPLRAPVPIPATRAASPLTSSLAYPDMTHSMQSTPSLEQAILVERQRRAVSGSSASPVPKGGRFKSSPLIGERNGVVVAEKIKRGGVVRGESLIRANSDRKRSEKDAE